jgi:methionyl-tRNA formyltransferase
MLLNGVVLLAAQTARSQAYIQALIAKDMYPEQVILLGDDLVVGNESPSGQSKYKNIFLPNLSESVSTSCEQANIPIIRTTICDINSAEIMQHIKNLAPQVIIYSGMGGQIVSDTVLKLGPKFLHIHSGWLPQYRGSTTLYYTLLNGDLPGATALILDKTIDTGPVLEKRHYPRPPLEMNIDKLYDTAIRADLLIHVLEKYILTRNFQEIETQNSEEGSTYYVIHPVLKHLAILSLSPDISA